MSCKYYCIDEIKMTVTKKGNKHILYQGNSVHLLLLLVIHKVIFSRIYVTTSYSNSSQRGARMTEGD